MRFLIPTAIAALALAGCSPEAEEPAVTPGDAAAEASATPTGQPAPEVFAATAWRLVAEDGARYTTMLDADGTYRDLRNGDPWQTGAWTYSDGEQGKFLCFTPDDDGAIERCWEPGRMTGGTMRATGDNGVNIELERVDYEPLANGDDQGA